MPARRHLYENAVLMVHANNPAWPASQVWKQLRADLRKLGGDDGSLPSEKTISRIIQRKAASDLSRFRYVYWPGSFGAPGGLPWEAAPSYFELVQFLAGRRPLIPLALWFWRMTQSAPKLETSIKWRAATDIALTEIRGVNNARYIETFLAAGSNAWLPTEYQWAPGLSARPSKAALERLGLEGYLLAYGGSPDGPTAMHEALVALGQDHEEEADDGSQG